EAQPLTKAPLAPACGCVAHRGSQPLFLNLMSMGLLLLDEIEHAPRKLGINLAEPLQYRRVRYRPGIEDDALSPNHSARCFRRQVRSGVRTPGAARRRALFGWSLVHREASYPQNAAVLDAGQALPSRSPQA